MSEDLQSLIEVLEISAKAKCSYMLGVKDVEMLVERLGSQVAEIERLQERAPEWISVEDDLPKDRKRVMVVVWPDTIKIGYHVKGFRQWATDDDIYYHDDLYNYITHWKPLPAPPESEE